LPTMQSQSSAISEASSSGSGSGSANVSPLDSAAALHLLLSPDGYYRYLNIPKPTTAHGGPAFLHPQQQQNQDEEKKPLKSSGTATEVDHDQVKKNYRRLSLRHHPDRPGGDVDTFRVLNRAKRVLTNPKLRKQYDLLGLDLDDDDEDHHEEGRGDGSHNDEKGGAGAASPDGKHADGGKTGGAANSSSGDGGSSSSSSSGPDSIMSHLASATIATIIQVAVRTAALGLASTLVCRYKLLLLPACAFMCFIAYRVRQAARTVAMGQVTTFQMVAPLVIVAGLVLMHVGRRSGSSGDPDVEPLLWSWTFWIGEAAVMTMFVVNSIQPLPAGQNVAVLVGGIAMASIVATLILRGKFWRYVAVVAFEAVLAFLAVLAFPIMEMILEEIMNEKLRKIGEQVRAHARRMDAYAEKKTAGAKSGHD